MVLTLDLLLKFIIRFCVIIVSEDPLCVLSSMKNSQDKAWFWSCHDCTEDEPSIEKLACRFQNVESKYFPILCKELLIIFGFTYYQMPSFSKKLLMLPNFSMLKQRTVTKI